MTVLNKDELMAALDDAPAEASAPAAEPDRLVSASPPAATPAKPASQPQRPRRQQAQTRPPAPETPVSIGEELGRQATAPPTDSAPQPATAESLEQMLEKLDQEAKEKKTAFAADISALAVRMAHHEIVDEARINERRRILEMAVQRRDQMMGTSAATTPTPDPSGTGDDEPPADGGDGGNAPTDATQVIDLTQMPTTAEELRDFIKAEVKPIADGLKGVEDYLSGNRLRRYKPAHPV